MDVFEFAMKMELDGKAYYEKLAGEAEKLAGVAGDRGLKGIFTRLAADEQKHYDTVLAMRAGSARPMADTTVLEEAKNLFEGLMVDPDIAGSMSRSLDGYAHARKVEADSVRLYEDMAQKEADPAIKGLLLRIAEEEKKHYTIMDNLYDFTLAPQNFLAWGEFSNLKEL